MGSSDIPRDEAEAALAARRELGRDYDDAIAESFTAKLDETIERRVAAEVERRLATPEQQRRRSEILSKETNKAFVLALGSLGISIPLLGAVSDGGENMLGIVLVLLTVILVNLAFNLARLRHR